MIKLLKKLGRNNKGSSLIVAIIAVSFVAILGTVIISSTMTNYSMRVMNYQSKKTFYSAQTALDEIYSGISTECYNQLETAYLSSVTELVNNNRAVDNATANSNMRILYLTNLKKKLDTVNGGMDTSDALSSKANLIKYMESFITRTKDSSPDKYAYVDSVGNVDFEGDKITINDVVVVYVSTKDEYYSNIAVDMVMGYPDVTFNFVDNRNHLNTYLDYCLIGMDGVAAGTSTNKIDASVTGGVFAGDESVTPSMKGLTVNNQSILSLDEAVLVSAANATVNGTLNLTSSRIWGVNFNVRTDADVSSDAASTIYLADDLNLAGNNANVMLAGALYGFGWSQNAGDSSAHSSAIVINGDKNTVDISALAKMVMAGRAYINVSDGYMTADSLGLKELQEIYLVPTRYMQITNPCVPTADKDGAVDTDALAGDDSTFFAADLLNKSNPVVRKDDGGTARYFYLNFKDNASRVQYVRRILDSSYSDRDGWAELNTIVSRCLEKLGTASIPGGDAIKTNGNLYSVNGSSISASGGAFGADELRKNCDDKYNRYKLLKMFLYDIGSDDVDDNDSKWAVDVTDGALVSINELKTTKVDGKYEKGASEEHVIDSSRSIYDYVIDTSKWDEMFSLDEYKDLEFYKSEAKAGSGSYGVVVPSGASALKISSIGVTQGVILANDRDIIVDRDFTGLIITDGNITISGDVTIIADREITESTIKAIPLLKQFFFAYQGIDGDALGGDDIKSEDLLSYDNWRKNYVAETEAETK